jgi:hypothetical protein
MRLAEHELSEVKWGEDGIELDVKRETPCGWVYAYIECLMSEYGYTLNYIINELLMEVGLGLLSARSARLNPDGTYGYVDQEVTRARVRIKNAIINHNNNYE